MTGIAVLLCKLPRLVEVNVVFFMTAHTGRLFFEVARVPWTNWFVGASCLVTLSTLNVGMFALENVACLFMIKGLRVELN